MLVWSECPAVERVPGKVSREWLFKGKARARESSVQEPREWRAGRRFPDLVPACDTRGRWSRSCDTRNAAWRRR